MVNELNDFNSLSAMVASNNPSGLLDALYNAGFIKNRAFSRSPESALQLFMEYAGVNGVTSATALLFGVPVNPDGPYYREGVDFINS